MPTDTAAVKQKVQDILVRTANGVQLETNGFSIQQGSTRIFIRFWASKDEAVTYIGLTVPILTELADTPELHEYVAYHSDDWNFGHLYLEKWDSGVAILMAHTLLGDYLDEDELAYAAFGMMSSGDALDDELKGRFGGRRYHEPPAAT